MALLSNLGQALVDGQGLVDLGLSQVAGGKAAEVTVNPSSAHGHVGNDDVFVLAQNDMIFDLLRSSKDITYIYGSNDQASYSDGGSQNIFDLGKGTTLSFSNQTGGIQVYDFANDPTGKIVLSVTGAAPSLTPDGHGGTMLGNIDFVGDAHLSMAQIKFTT